MDACLSKTAPLAIAKKDHHEHADVRRRRRPVGASIENHAGRFSMRLLLCLIAVPLHVLAQVGSLDTNFIADANFESPNDHRFFAKVDSQGRYVVAGSFTSINGTNRARVARLYPDGTLDPTFDPGEGPVVIGYPTVQAMDLEPDGKVIIAGRFTNVNGYLLSRYVARLNTDGSVDMNFRCNPGPSSPVRAVALAPDGKVYIGGSFIELSGYNVQHVGRLHTNGHADFSFRNTWNHTSPLALAVQRDGKVIAAGHRARPAADSDIVRFNSDGSRDTTFSAATDVGIRSLAIDNLDRIVIGGEFEFVNGTRHPKLARLNPDGSLDTSFNPPITDSVVFTGPWTLSRTTGDRLLVGGSFTKADGFPRDHLFRVHDDGSLDESFDCRGVNGDVMSMAVHADGGILIGGSFTMIDGVPRSRIARLWGDPVLRSERMENGSMRLKWPSVYTNYTLQAASTLPDTKWLSVDSPPSPFAADSVVTNAISGSNKFFRLIKQQ